jgi:hypothetical protein
MLYKGFSMKNIKNMLIVSLLIAQGLFARTDSIFTTAGKKMVATEVAVVKTGLTNGLLVGVGIGMVASEAGDDYNPRYVLPAVQAFSGVGAFHETMFEKQATEFKKIDIKETVGQAGEALTWGTAGIAGCTPILYTIATINGIPLSLQQSAAGCTALYGAYVVAAACERDSQSK